MLAKEVVERFLDALVRNADAHRATRRVLVACHTKAVGFKGVVDAVTKVAAANPGKEIPRNVLVIAAPWDAKPQSNDGLRALFESQIVGAR